MLFTTGVHRFSKDTDATSKFKAPVKWREASYIRRAHR